MADWLKTIKNVMDAHGAWVFGGAVAAGLVARRAAQKRRSFDADWFSVTCYGCGRSGFSDEMARITAPDGRDVYSCVRCQRPDLFKQAEGDDDMVICEGCGELRKVDEDFTIDNAREDTLDDGPVSCDRCWENHYAYVDECTCDDLPDDHPDWMKGMCESCYDRWASAWSSKGAEATNACPHCEGAAGFPREFYYQSDRIDMVPCGTCLTQGRCPGCMEIYPGLTRDNTPEDVFFNTGCTRCGYSESDARAARRTARRWVELVDNPAAAKFMAEDDDDDTYQECPKCGVDDYPRPDGKGGDCWWCTWYDEDKADDDAECHCRGFSKDEDSVCPRCKVEYVCGCKVNNITDWKDGDVGVCMDCVEEIVESMDAEDDYHPTHGEICGNCGVANTWPDNGSYFICECGADRDFSSLKARLYQIILAVEDMADNDDPDYDEIYEGWVDTLKEVLNQLEERMDAEDDLPVLEICNVCGDRTHTDTVEIQVCEKHTASDYGLFYPDYWEGDAEGVDRWHSIRYNLGSQQVYGPGEVYFDLGREENLHRLARCYMATIRPDDEPIDLDTFIHADPSLTPAEKAAGLAIQSLFQEAYSRDAEDYGVGAVWMAERYDPNTHGAFLPAGSVKRFLSTIPLRTPFFVEFQKSNGDLRSMNAIFTKPFDADGTAAGVLEVFPGGSSKRSSFKRFRVDRVVTLYRI